MTDNNDTELLRDKLFNKKENGWNLTKEKDNIFNYAKGYISFMNKAKTEREVVKQAKIIAENSGFKDINNISMYINKK